MAWEITAAAAQTTGHPNFCHGLGLLIVSSLVIFAVFFVAHIARLATRDIKSQKGETTWRGE